MKCSVCGKEAVIEIPYEGKAYCEKHFIERFKRRVRKTITRNKLIQPKEKIGFAVSGGKDSLTAMYVISPLIKKWHLDAVAITIDEGIKGYRSKTIKNAKKMADELGIPYLTFSFKDEIGITDDEIAKMKRQRAVCSYCGVFRRWILNRKAKELGLDKLVLGHNLDDEVQAIMMNFMRGEFDRIARMGPEVGVARHSGFVPRVKPLRKIPEREVTLFAYLHGYWDPEEKSCPYMQESFRNQVRKRINEMEAMFPGTKYSILSSGDGLVETLKKTMKFGKPKKCEICGEPSAGGICQRCQLMTELGLDPKIGL